MDEIFRGDGKLIKLQTGITLLLVLFLSVTGATYAYFAVSATNSTTITGDAATVNLTLNVTKVFPSASSSNTGVMVPQKSVSASNTSPLSSALKKGCIDDNGNVVCHVYRINIKNDGGTATQVVDGMVSFYSDNTMNTGIQTAMPNLRWKLVNTVNSSSPTNSVLGIETDKIANGTDTKFVTNVTLSTGTVKDYYMIIWINETDNNQSDNSSESNRKKFYGKVSFGSSNGTGVTSTFET